MPSPLQPATENKFGGRYLSSVRAHISLGGPYHISLEAASHSLTHSPGKEINILDPLPEKLCSDGLCAVGESCVL